MQRLLKAASLRVADLGPGPVAAITLFALCVGLIVVVVVDWSTAGLPQQGEPGRVDWAMDKYYKGYRMKLEADRKAMLKAHPDLKEFEHMPAVEIRHRLEDRAESH